MKREMLRKMMCFLLVPVFLLVALGLAQAADVKVYAFNAGVLKTETQYMLKDTRVGTPIGYSDSLPTYQAWKRLDGVRYRM